MVCNIKGWNKNDEFWRFQSSDIKSWKENEHDVWSLTSEESGGVRVWGNRNNHNQLSFLCRERVFGEREKKGKTQRKKWKDGRVKCRSQEKMTEWETRRERKVSAWCFYWICQHGSRGLGYFYMWGRSNKRWERFRYTCSKKIASSRLTDTRNLLRRKKIRFN